VYRASRFAMVLAMLLAAAAAPAHAPDPRLDYVMHCMGCHGMDGEGVRGKIPALRESLPAFVRSRAGRDFLLSVPGASNSSLTDAELAGVMNWLADRFASGSPAMAGNPFTTEEVTRARRPPQSKVRENRARLLQSLAGGGPLPTEDY
jgi:hypothetical protein